MLIDVTAEHIYALHGSSPRLMRVSGRGAESWPYRGASGVYPRPFVLARDTLVTSTEAAVMRCPLGSGWIDIQPVDMISNARSPIPRSGGGYTAAYYRPTDPRYVWPPSEPPEPSGIRFDPLGRALTHARLRECGGDGCASYAGWELDVRAGLARYDSPDPRYRALVDRYDRARPAPDALIGGGSVATLREILPRWMLYLVREGSHDVLRLVDPTNQHATVLARRLAEGWGQCWRGGECERCSGAPYIERGALAPDGSWLVLITYVHEPACDCHTSELATAPIHVSVPRMLAFARSITASRPRSSPR